MPIIFYSPLQTTSFRQPPMECFSSSSSEIGQIPPQHQVFINFRGEELREGFVGFLVQALLKEKVNVFVDEHELRSRDLGHLFKRIAESRIAMAIFSERYTESRWCLDELAKIKESMDKGNLKVIPIFFKLQTDDVKRLKGKFGDNFRDLRRLHRAEPQRTRKWKEALKSVTKKFGLSSSGYRYQTDFVKSIVKEVKKVLRDISVGEYHRDVMDSFVEEADSFIEKVTKMFADTSEGEYQRCCVKSIVEEYMKLLPYLPEGECHRLFLDSMIEEVMKVFTDVSEAETRGGQELPEVTRNEISPRHNERIEAFGQFLYVVLFWIIVVFPRLWKLCWMIAASFLFCVILTNIKEWWETRGDRCKGPPR